MYLSGGVMDSDCTHCLACVGGSYEMGAGLVVRFVLPNASQVPAFIGIVDGLTEFPRRWEDTPAHRRTLPVSFHLLP
jgi:hypothetical protein